MKQPCKFSCVGLYFVDVGEVLNKTPKVLLHVHLHMGKKIGCKVQQFHIHTNGFSYKSLLFFVFSYVFFSQNKPKLWFQIDNWSIFEIPPIIVLSSIQILYIKWFAMTLNYWMIVERCPN